MKTNKDEQETRRMIGLVTIDRFVWSRMMSRVLLRSTGWRYLLVYRRARARLGGDGDVISWTEAVEINGYHHFACERPINLLEIHEGGQVNRRRSWGLRWGWGWEDGVEQMGWLRSLRQSRFAYLLQQSTSSLIILLALLSFRSLGWTQWSNLGKCELKANIFTIRRYLTHSLSFSLITFAWLGSHQPIPSVQPSLSFPRSSAWRCWCVLVKKSKPSFA